MSERQANTPTLRALLPSRLVPEDMLSEWQGPNLPNTKNYAPPPDSMRGRMGDVLMQGIAALGGFTGLPMGGEGSKAALLGELLAAGMPLVGGVKGTLKNLVSRTLTNGFYSRLDEAAVMIPKKGVPATGVMNWLKKAPEGISQEEAAYRKLPEFLASRGNQTVTPEMLTAHLKANPAPFPKVKTLGGEPSKRVSIRDKNGINLGYYDTRDDAERAFRKMAAAGTLDGKYMLDAPTPTRPKFDKPDYQVPGGENYRETLLTLPGEPLPIEEWAKQYRDFDPSVTPEQLQRAYAKYVSGDSGITVRDKAEFRSSHYPDYPDLLVHTRANERTLPSGEPGRFIEEVQSDWHQQGLKKGYRIPGDRDRANNLLRQMDEIEREVGLAQAADDPRYRALGAELDTASTQNPSSVPDAPFKENWPDLGLKQQLIETANDPNAEWMGFTGGKTQADRYDLSKQISRIEYEPISDPAGTYELQAYDHNDRLVLSEDEISLDRVEQLVGKEIAEKVKSGGGVVQDEGGYRDWRTLSGLDLQVGGEGMDVFYDRKLPKRLEKIVKPFGGTVEQGAVSTNPRIFEKKNGWFAETPAGQDGPFPTRELAAEHWQGSSPSWLSRLTPEMKAAIKRGVPLMSIVAAALSAGLISTADAQQIKQQGYR